MALSSAFEKIKYKPSVFRDIFLNQVGVRLVNNKMQILSHIIRTLKKNVDFPVAGRSIQPTASSERLCQSRMRNLLGSRQQD